MGIIVHYPPSDKYMLYVKGADTVMKEKVRVSQKATCGEYCENIAREGLRTLVIAQKQLCK
jgi:phospholipid-translocating ATPase